MINSTSRPDVDSHLIIPLVMRNEIANTVVEVCIYIEHTELFDVRSYSSTRGLKTISGLLIVDSVRQISQHTFSHTER